MSDALSESRFHYFRFSKEKFVRQAKKISKKSRSNGVLCASIDGQPVGMIYCTFGELEVATQAYITTVNLFFVTRRLRASLLGGKAALGLLSGLESWTRHRGGKEILVHSNFGEGGDRTHRFLRRRGFETLGGCYAIRCPCNDGR